ncbi:Response regulators consisting of a CheY-like receiver domain and a winged-helix DNA-binding domain [Mesorhizobium sp. J18]|uniref:winged helix-turn-helix domain-containing protein n=1 Tax=Mesorhizobium sp. J18 TaxID=935263 RepID=UPI00119B0235|nr:helix-turn-helix domain-containing protein [Mesorhizobium sp. J18]TWG90256.1 Response regulators consisting of a CheY-like receiver domain and a winged-helix DNA-binding domain [Mesorhizobium sp. J18]
MVRYHDLVFQPDMLTAKRDDGETIRLTRQERALLLRFVRQPQELVTRAQLLEALGDETGTLSERNVDYLVNRLRKRLGDSARSARFIVTQYGEGYVWAAEPVETGPLSAFLLIGPIYGLGDGQSALNGFPHRLASALKAATGAKRTILFRPGWRFDLQSTDKLDFTLDVSAHTDTEHLHLALVLREGRSRRVIESFRRTWPRGRDPNHVNELARTLTDALWRHEALPDGTATEPTDRPAHTRLHDAAVMLTDDTMSWRENAARLKQAHEADKADPRHSVMLALNHYARLIQSLGEIHTAPLGDDDWQALESEIEDLALRALPDVHDKPHLLLAIAKLLRFIDRGYLELAERLTEEAFLNSTAFAAAFSMKAQIAASKGEIDEAAILYDKAIELAEPGSQFHIYLLILKAAAMMAGDKRGTVDHLAAELHNFVPGGQAVFGLFLVSPKAKTLVPPLEHALAAMLPELGQHLTTYLFRVSARQFRRRIHQRNILSGLVVHLQRHHGEEAIAPEIAKRFPEIMMPPGKPRRRSK